MNVLKTDTYKSLQLKEDQFSQIYSRGFCLRRILRPANGRGDVEDTTAYALAERLRFWFGNQKLGRKRYNDLQIRADACNDCRKCLSQCPYQIDIPRKLHLADYKLADKNIF